jgi:hypothetical protein
MTSNFGDLGAPEQRIYDRPLLDNGRVNAQKTRTEHDLDRAYSRRRSSVPPGI